jgi:hypothetical protein
MVLQDEVLVGKKHPILLTANAPKEVRCTQCFGSILPTINTYGCDCSDLRCRRSLSRKSWFGTILTHRNNQSNTYTCINSVLSSQFSPIFSMACWTIFTGSSISHRVTFPLICRFHGLNNVFFTQPLVLGGIIPA